MVPGWLCACTRACVCDCESVYWSRGSPAAPAASQPAKAATTTRQLPQTGSDCGFICNYLPLQCRCRQQLLFRMGTVEFESGSEPGYHNCPPGCSTKTNMPPVSYPSLPPPTTSGPLALVVAQPLDQAQSLVSCSSCINYCWAVAVNMVTWPYGQMTKWHYNRTDRRRCKALTPLPRPIYVMQGEEVRGRGVSVRIPSKAPHWAHKFSHRARMKDVEWNSSYASI